MILKFRTDVPLHTGGVVLGGRGKFCAELDCFFVLFSLIFWWQKQRIAFTSSLWPVLSSMIILNYLDLPSYGSEKRKRYTQRLFILMFLEAGEGNLICSTWMNKWHTWRKGFIGEEGETAGYEETMIDLGIICKCHF